MTARNARRSAEGCSARLRAALEARQRGCLGWQKTRHALIHGKDGWA